MFKTITILMLALPLSVQAGELKIIETETGIIAEFSGSPSSAGNDIEVPGTAVDNDNASMVDFINAQIEQLKKDAAEISKLTGKETEEELALIKAHAYAKDQQIKAYSDELDQLTGIAESKEADVVQSAEEQPSQQQDYRQEMKIPLRALKRR